MGLMLIPRLLLPHRGRGMDKLERRGGLILVLIGGTTTTGLLLVLVVVVVAGNLNS
jgi:hypothetical protein